MIGGIGKEEMGKIAALEGKWAVSARHSCAQFRASIENWRNEGGGRLRMDG